MWGLKLFFLLNLETNKISHYELYDKYQLLSGLFIAKEH